MLCQSLVVKIASRCNLNCTYCYMYNMGDTTYLSQPKFMAPETIDHLLERVREHCVRHNLNKYFIVFHGGEPLMVHQDFIINFVNRANSILARHVAVKFQVQTNGVLLNDSWCRLLKNLDIGVGISLDGTKEAHDEFRLYHSGKGSYDDVVAGIKTAQKYRPVSVLSVMNISISPDDIFLNYKQLKLKAVGLLFPDGTHDHLPLGKQGKLSGDTSYGDWLIRMFDLWYDDGAKLGMRLFEQIVSLILGEESGDELLGSDLNEVLVIETNGGIEASDPIRVCGNGFTKTNVNVKTHDIDEALKTELAKEYYYSHKNLCAQCMRCPVKQICGSGFLPHRFSSKNRFDNPSIYCLDLMKLIAHVQNRILDKLPANVLEECELEKMTFEQIKEIVFEPSAYSEI